MDYKVFKEEEPKNRDPLFFQAPCRVLVAGPSGSGKTVFIMNTLLYEKSPWDTCYYFYSVSQPKYETLDKNFKGKITFVEGIPENAEEQQQSGWWDRFKEDKEQGHKVVVVFDDLMKEIENSTWASKLYTAGCHHLGLSVFELCQRVMVNREQRLQCDYIVLFNFPMDQKAIFALAQQLEPQRYKEVMQMYEQATLEHTRGWLLIDAKCINMGRKELKYRCNSFSRIFDWWHANNVKDVKAPQQEVQQTEPANKKTKTTNSVPRNVP